MAKIELKGLSKRFGGTQVLEKLDLTVRDGEFFCLVGPSGCGKTTLLNLIAGLEAPSGGALAFDGKDVTGLGPRERDVAMVFQSYALYPHMSARENIAFPLKVRGVPAAELARRVDDTARLLGLEKLLDRRPRQLSGGQQQRVALGRALIRRPKVFLLDEPLSNLDAKLRTQMRIELKRLHQQLPVTTVYVTHDQEEALSLSDRMAILKGGEVQQLGGPQEVYDRPSNLFVARFIGKPEMNSAEVFYKDKKVELGSGAFYLFTDLKDRLAAHGSRFVMGVRPEHVQVGRDGLPAFVKTVEPMGSETWVDLTVGGVDMLAKVPGRFDGAPRAEVKVTWREEHLHFFSADTEARLPVDAPPKSP